MNDVSTNPSTGRSEMRKYAAANSGARPQFLPCVQRQTRPAMRSASGRNADRARSADVPARINDAQPRRQQNLVEIEPRDPSGGGDARGRALGPDDLSDRDGLVMLEPDRHAPQREREREERETPRQVLQRNLSPPPPRAEKQHRRQHDDRGLRQQSQEEQTEGK